MITQPFAVHVLAELEDEMLEPIKAGDGHEKADGAPALEVAESGVIAAREQERREEMQAETESGRKGVEKGNGRENEKGGEEEDVYAEERFPSQTELDVAEVCLLSDLCSFLSTFADCCLL
jgi:hypothetical protein